MAVNVAAGARLRREVVGEAGQKRQALGASESLALRRRQDWKGRNHGKGRLGRSQGQLPAPRDPSLIQFFFPFVPAGSQAEGQADADGGVAAGV